MTYGQKGLLKQESQTDYLRLRPIRMDHGFRKEVPEGILVARHAKDTRFEARAVTAAQESLERVKREFPVINKTIPRTGVELVFLPSQEFNLMSRGEMAWGPVAYVNPATIIIDEDRVASDPAFAEHMQRAACEHLIGKGGWHEFQVPPGLSWAAKDVIISEFMFKTFKAKSRQDAPEVSVALFISRRTGFNTFVEEFFQGSTASMQKALERAGIPLGKLAGCGSSSEALREIVSAKGNEAILKEAELCGIILEGR